jgi:LPS-assembly lipoprotein
LPTALSGCSWTPLYADREAGPADEALRSIRVAPIAERIGQRLELALRNSLNPEGIPTPQRYLLSATLQTYRSDLGIQSTGIGTRGKLDVNCTLILSDLKNGARLLQSSAHVAESFDIVANEYASLVAEDDARTRAVEELRREILSELVLFMQKRAADGKLAGNP